MSEPVLLLWGLPCGPSDQKNRQPYSLTESCEARRQPDHISIAACRLGLPNESVFRGLKDTSHVLGKMRILVLEYSSPEMDRAAQLTVGGFTSGCQQLFENTDGTCDWFPAERVSGRQSCSRRTPHALTKGSTLGEQRSCRLHDSPAKFVKQPTTLFHFVYFWDIDAFIGSLQRRWGMGDPLEQQSGHSLSSELPLSQNTGHDGQKPVPGSRGAAAREISGTCKLTVTSRQCDGSVKLMGRT